MKYDIKRLSRSILSGLLTLILCFSVCAITGCSSTEDFTLYYGVDKAPNNLDPLLASSDSEKLFIRNCFRGLYRLNSNDDAVADLAKECRISDDGLTYTFTLNSCKWSDGQTVTAADFLFAIKRAADPSVKASGTELIMNIKGVGERLNGQNREIGVSAPDETTLVIELINPDSNFLLKLTQPIFMPCNEYFFNKCGGKYGLGSEYIITNGNFEVASWSNEKNLKLKRVTERTENGVVAEYVVLSESQTGKLNTQRIKDKEIGMTVVNGEDYTQIDTDSYNISLRYCKNYAIRFNKASTIGSRQDLTEALAKGINRYNIFENTGDRFQPAFSCLPKDTLLLDSYGIGDIDIANHAFEFSAENSRQEFLSAVKSLNNSKLPTIEILCPDNAEIKAILTKAISFWQSNLGAVINIKMVKSDSEVTSLVNDGSYSVAFVALEANVESILSSFSGENASAEYNACIAALNTTDDISTAKAQVKKATDILSTDSSVIPIVGVPTAYIYSDEYNNVHFSKIDGTVDFSIIYK